MHIICGEVQVVSELELDYLTLSGVFSAVCTVNSRVS